MVRRFRPRRIVEVGSGHSTRFLARAVADGATGTRITAIDPEPRATLAGLDIELLRMRVQDSGDTPFAHLGDGDFLVVDSSHKMAPGSDVELLLQHVLPGLPAGGCMYIFTTSSCPTIIPRRGPGAVTPSRPQWQSLFRTRPMRSSSQARGWSLGARTC